MVLGWTFGFESGLKGFDSGSGGSDSGLGGWTVGFESGSRGSDLCSGTSGPTIILETDWWKYVDSLLAFPSSSMVLGWTFGFESGSKGFDSGLGDIPAIDFLRLDNGLSRHHCHLWVHQQHSWLLCGLRRLLNNFDKRNHHL